MSKSADLFLLKPESKWFFLKHNQEKPVLWSKGGSNEIHTELMPKHVKLLFFSLGENQALLLQLSENLPMKGFLSNWAMLKHIEVPSAIPGTSEEHGPRMWNIFFSYNWYLIIDI